jgi:hypothetical protein
MRPSIRFLSCNRNPDLHHVFLIRHREETA